MRDASRLSFGFVSKSPSDFLAPRATGRHRVASAPIRARSVRTERVGSTYCTLEGIAATAALSSDCSPRSGRRALIRPWAETLPALKRRSDHCCETADSMTWSMQRTTERNEMLGRWIRCGRKEGMVWFGGEDEVRSGSRAAVTPATGVFVKHCVTYAKSF